MFNEIDQDLTSERKVRYLDTEVIVYKDGPYNMWKIRLPRGPTPAELSGMYTTVYEAEKVINIRHERMSNSKAK